MNMFLIVLFDLMLALAVVATGFVQKVLFAEGDVDHASFHTTAFFFPYTKHQVEKKLRR